MYILNIYIHVYKYMRENIFIYTCVYIFQANVDGYVFFFLRRENVYRRKTKQIPVFQQPIPKNPQITNFFYICNSVVIIFFDVVID